MRQLITELIACTRANSSCPITIGTNTKWHYAYSDLGVDFLSLHTYAWQEPFFPTYTVAPSYVTNTGLPVFIGEYPPASSGSNSIAANTEIMQGYCDNGYIGFAPWQYGEVGFGFDATSLAEQKAFADAQVKVISQIVVSPSVIACGSSQNVTIKTQNGCGNNLDSLAPTVDSGTLTNVVYNSLLCCWSATYNSPACPTNTTATIRATDSTGAVALGQVTVAGEVETTCISSTASVLVSAGDCIVVPFSFECGGCDCCATWTQIDGPTSCYGAGDILVFAVAGCDCDVNADGTGGCGPIDWNWKTAGSHPEVCLVMYDPNWLGQNTLTIGPLKSKRVGEIELCCADIPVCPECP